MNPIENNNDYSLTLYETCEILGKSTRTVTRYVHRHILHPRGIKSRQGTLEYRFSMSEIKALQKKQNEIGRFEYCEQDEMGRTPAASFANFSYQPGVKSQASFAIPGISFPEVSNSPAVDRMSNQLPNYGVQPGDYRADPVTEKKEEPEPAVQMPEEKKDPVPVSAAPMAQSRDSDMEIISLLKETTGMLRDQLKVKDDQIKNLDDKVGQLIERNRETNILLKGLQDKMVLLEKPKNEGLGRMERAEQSQASEPVIKKEDRNESNHPVPLPRESKASEPIKVKVYSGASESSPTDTPAKVLLDSAGAGNYSVPETKDGKDIKSGKKGLFGKMFG